MMSPPANGSGSAPRTAVLCVDDDPEILACLRRLLRAEPYDLLVAESSDSALKILGERPVRLIITDQRMPGQSGTDLLQEVHRRYPETQRLLLTAFPGSPGVSSHLGRDIEWLISKPWNDEALKLAIRQLLQGRKDSRKHPSRGGFVGLHARDLGRKSARIRSDIIARMGGFPPFFVPALEATDLLRTLWRRTVSSYLDNPLPALFKEKLFASLSRFSPMPYSLVVHVCALRSLGMKAPDILRFLEEPAGSTDAEPDPSYPEMDQAQAPLPDWPDADSPLEKEVLRSSVLLFREGVKAEPSRRRLERLLGPSGYARLAEFISYIRACHGWTEMFPDLSPDGDPRVCEHRSALIAEEPRLGAFLTPHGKLNGGERRRLEDRLRVVIAELRERETALRVIQDNLETRVLERTSELSRLNAQLALEVLERKRAEEELRDRTVDLENALEGISRLDTRGRFLNSNKTFADMLGFAPEELPDIRWRRLVERGDRKAVLSAYQVMKARGRAELEIRGVRKTGERFHAHLLLLRALDRKGRFDGAHSFVKDITARKQAEEERDRLQNQVFQGQKLAALGQLSAGIAHEINNPVGYILSNLNTMAEYAQELVEIFRSAGPRNPQVERPAIGRSARPSGGSDPAFLLEDLAKAIQESRQGAERIRDIVRGLGQFSHIDEGEIRHADPRLILEDALRLCWNEVKYRAEVKRDFGAIPKIPCFPMRLGQVFLNLLVNAAQSMEQRGILTISTRLEGEEVVIRVRDTGCGIPPEHRPRLFEPFFTTKPVGKGTGLGLHVAYKIVKGHGGHIEVDSTMGRGTEFAVHLPVAGPPLGGARGIRKESGPGPGGPNP